ncbi:MAG: hypothetical protein M3463_10800 [Verrucomicrobiota bacterium]|nr:hypothetical protein [Verrucomicrobiota bacterium]
MIHPSHTTPSAPDDTSRDETISKLVASLREGVQALRDPDIEAKARD